MKRNGRLSPRLCAAASIVALALSVGCGYHAGLPLAEGRTIGIEIFSNESRTELAPGLERDLHREVSDVLIRLANAPLLPPDEANRRITGRILRYHFRPGIRNEDNELLETGLRIEVQAEIRDRSGNVLKQTEISSQTGYVIDSSTAERDATDRVLGNLAERLVLDLMAPLGEDLPVDEEPTEDPPADPALGAPTNG